MFKVVICLSMFLACIMSAPAPGVLVGAPVVTASSSQVVARNYNAAFAVPAAVPVVHSAPLLAAPAFAPHAIAAPAFAPHAIAAPAFAPHALAAPAFAPALAAPLSAYPYLNYL